ncbi:MAG: hypothetical protein ACR2L2_07995 [Acidobacteriota bacterium]
MRPRTRKILVVLAAIPVTVFGLIVAAGAVSSSAGAVMVHVHRKEPGPFPIIVPVPVLLLRAAVALAPADKFEPAITHLRSLLPNIRAAVESLQEIPDCVLVEGQNARETFSVVKSGGSLVIDVETENETVHVSLPVSALSGLLASLERKMD